AYAENLGPAAKAKVTLTLGATPTAAVRAHSILTMATNPTAQDTLTVGNVVYTFVASGAVAGQINRGVDAAASRAAVIAAINGSDSINEAHPCAIAAAVSSTVGV